MHIYGQVLAPLFLLKWVTWARESVDFFRDSPITSVTSQAVLALRLHSTSVFSFPNYPRNIPTQFVAHMFVLRITLPSHLKVEGRKKKTKQKGQQISERNKCSNGPSRSLSCQMVLFTFNDYEAHVLFTLSGMEKGSTGTFSFVLYCTLCNAYTHALSEWKTWEILHQCWSEVSRALAVCANTVTERRSWVLAKEGNSGP